MPTLGVANAALNYEIWGDGTSGWITLVNGHTRPLNDFRMLGRKLAEAGFRVLAFDNRGAGNTTVSGAFTLNDMCSDVLALWDMNGIGTTKLLGISMGGFISQQLALEHPDRIEKLILVSTASQQDGISPDNRPWTGDIAQVAEKLSAYFTPEFAEKNAVLVRSMAKQIAAQVEQGRYVEHSRMQRQALEGFDCTSRLAAISAPTLVIHGEEDAIIPIAEGEALIKRIPGARLVPIKNAGHLLLAEAPAQLYQVVLDFFQS